jgi:2-hydroxy-6-oxonona-2,4-dienedioate hydrolase
MSRLLAGLLISAGAVAALIYAVFKHDLSKARAALDGRGAVIETALGTIEYAKTGKGYPVLVVHGAGGGFDQGLEMAGGLAGRGYELVAPSRFGYLRSAAATGLTVPAQADAYAALLDRLGIGKVAAVAISAGAWSALEFAVRHPDRCQALVLLVPAKQLPPGTSNYGGAIAKAMLGSDFITWALLKLRPVLPGTLDRIMLGTEPHIVQAARPGEKARMQRILDGLLPISARFDGIEFDLKTAASPHPTPLDQIKCPLLAVSAEDDVFGTASRAREIAAAVPQGSTVIFPTGGHALAGRYDNSLTEAVSFLVRAGAARE